MHLDLSISKGQKIPNWAKWEDLITSKSNLAGKKCGNNTAPGKDKKSLRCWELMQPIELVTIRNLCRTLSLPTLDLIHENIREAAKIKVDKGSKSRGVLMPGAYREVTATNIQGISRSRPRPWVLCLDPTAQTLSAIVPPLRRTVSELGGGIKDSTQIFNPHVNLDRIHTSFLNIHSK